MNSNSKEYIRKNYFDYKKPLIDILNKFLNFKNYYKLKKI